MRWYYQYLLEYGYVQNFNWKIDRNTEQFTTLLFNCSNSLVHTETINRIRAEPLPKKTSCIFFAMVSLHACTVFSSTELNAQVSFSDHLQTLNKQVVHEISVSTFSHFHLFQNHWANFNQLWHKASLGEGNSSLFK